MPQSGIISMEKYFDIIFNIIIQEIEKMPGVYKIFSLIILSLILLYSFKPVFRKKANDTIVKMFRLLNSNIIATNELFFSEKYMLAQVDRIDLKDDAKEKLFKILLYKKIKAAISISTQWLKDNKFEFKKMSPLQLHQSLEVLISDIIKQYEIDILNKYQKEFGNQKGLKLFEHIYLKSFKPYHSDNIQFIDRTIHSVLHSKVKTVDIRIYNFFTIIYLILETAISDCEKVFDNFNGDLEKILTHE